MASRGIPDEDYDVGQMRLALQVSLAISPLMMFLGKRFGKTDGNKQSLIKVC